MVMAGNGLCRVSVEICVVGAHRNRLSGSILLGTRCMCFVGEGVWLPLGVPGYPPYLFT